MQQRTERAEEWMSKWVIEWMSEAMSLFGLKTLSRLRLLCPWCVLQLPRGRGNTGIQPPTPGAKA